MSERKKKVPPPAAVTAPDPGGKPNGGGAFVDWIKADIRNKESQAQADYSTGSEAGINNG